MHVGDLLLMIAALGGATAVFAAVAMRVYAYSQRRRVGIYESAPFARELFALTEQIDVSVKAFAAATGALVLVALLAVLIQSDFGNRATERGVGWAHDLSLVEAVYAGKDPGSLAPSLGELSFTPALSHRTVALVARVSGASPPAAYQATLAALVVLGSALVAVYVGLLGGPSAKARTAAAAAAVVALVAVNQFNFSFADYGDFLPQLFGTLVALALFLAVLRYRRRPRIAAPLAIVAGCGVLPFIDGISAAWFVSASWLLIASSYHGSLPGPLRRPAFAIPLMGAAMLALLAANPAFRSAWDLAANNGSFQFDLPYGSASTNLSENVPALLAIIAVIAGLVLLALFAVEGVPARGQLPRIIAANAGFLGVLLLMASAGFVHAVTGELSTYIVVRMLFLLAVQAAMSVSRAAAVAARDRYPVFPAQRWSPSPSAPVLAVAALLFFAQWPFLEYSHSQSALIEVRDSLVAHADDPVLRDQGSRPYPQFAVKPIENYYLAVGVLRIARDGRTSDWLAAGTKGAANVPFAWANHALPQYDGRAIVFKSGGNAPTFMESGWSQPEGFGTWTDGPSAELAWRWVQRPEGMVMTVTALANVSDSHPEQRVNVIVNGQQVDSWLFKNGEQLTSRRAIVPPSVLGATDTADVRFQIVDPVPPPGEPRLLGLAFQQISAAPIPSYDGRRVGFGDKANGVPYLWDGWSAPEEAGTWSSTASARLIWQNAIPAGAETVFTFKTAPFLNDAHPSFSAQVFVNDRPLATWQFRNGETPVTTVRVPAAVLAASTVTEIRIEFQSLASPSSLGQSGDTRLLGVRLQELAAN